MGIKRFIADADTTITNAFSSNLLERSRATGSNMGESDVVEVFSIYDQGQPGFYKASDGRGDASTGSVELSRALFKFPVSDISTQRTNGNIPASGSVNFYLRLFNAKHAFTVPRQYKMVINPVSQSWEEGTGLDMEEYKDITHGKEGANWVFASDGTQWETAGATATLTWNAGNRPDAGDTITIIDTAGTSKAYLAAGSQDLTTDPPKFHASNTTTTQVDSLQACIESENGHNGTITVSQDADTGLIMTLAQGTAGSDGNTPITRSGIVDDQITVSNNAFAGGTDGKGGAYRNDYEQTVDFDRGHEDLEADITPLVERWIDGGNWPNYGISVRLSSSYEGYFSSSTAANTASVIHNTGGAKKSYYTKKFFARGSEFYFKRPIIEARWDSSRKDDRANFFYSSSLASGEDNLNTLYLYNYVRGQLKDLPGLSKTDGETQQIRVSLHSGSHSENRRPTQQKLALSVGGNVASDGAFYATAGHTGITGIYSASLAVTSSTAIPKLTKLFDVWYNSADDSIEYHTGTIDPRDLNTPQQNPSPKFVTKITNLKAVYSDEETARFRLYVREKNWNPNIYTKATSSPETTIIDDAYYKIIRVTDNLTVVNYGTGSTNVNYTRLSFDVSGNYFDFGMSILERDYAYGIKFAYYVNGAYHEQPELFKFRIENTL